MIDPDKWEKVVELHLGKFPGRNVGSLHRNYTSIHRKKVPAGNHNIPEEACLVKQIQYMTGDWAKFVWGEEDYDMMPYRFNGGEKGNISPVVNITINAKEGAPTCNSSRQIVVLKVKRSKKAAKPDILTIMMM